ARSVPPATCVAPAYVLLLESSSVPPVRVIPPLPEIPPLIVSTWPGALIETGWARTTGAEIAWSPAVSVIDALPVMTASVSADAPAIVYEFAFEKTIPATVCGESTVTVRGADMAELKLAVAKFEFGTPLDQLAELDQLP